MKVIEETNYSSDEKLEYLKKDIEKDCNTVIIVIKHIQENYQIGRSQEEYDNNKTCLDNLTLWIEENYQ